MLVAVTIPTLMLALANMYGSIGCTQYRNPQLNIKEYSLGTKGLVVGQARFEDMDRIAVTFYI